MATYNTQQIIQDEKKLIDLQAAFQVLQRIVGKLQQDAGQSRTPPPTGDSGGGWVGFTHGTTPPVSGNVFGQNTTANVDLVKPAANGQPAISLGLPYVALLNGTGGTIPSGVYCGGTTVSGLYIVNWADCTNPTTATAPNAAPASPLATQDENGITTENDQQVTTE